MKHLLTVLIVSLFLSSGYSQSTEQNPIEYIKTESVGGKLDFNKTLKEEGKAKGFMLFDGVAYNSTDFALILWGQAVKKLGIPTFKEAKDLWESIYQSELSKANLKALKKGYTHKA